MTQAKTFKRLIHIFILELPVFLLNMQKGKIGIIISSFLYLTLCIFIHFLTSKHDDREQYKDLHFPLSTVLLVIISVVLFYFRWGTSGRLVPLAKILKLESKQTCWILGFMLSALAVLGIDLIISEFTAAFSKKSISEHKYGSYTNVYIFIVSFLTITLNSKCSPLYPINNWTDPNFLLTVGKGIIKGLVPYRDLYEQKGPVLLFIHAVGAAISFDSFHGIWILEIIFCFVFLLLIFKTTQLFFCKNTYLLIPIAAVLTYSCTAFEAGDSAEEFCLPLMAYSLYVGCRSLLNKELPTKKEFFFVGITSACIFWIKYSMTGFYLGWFLTFLFFALINKQMKNLFTGTIAIILGLLLVSIPIIAYFEVNTALKDFYEAYFYNNLFRYTETGTTFYQKMMLGIFLLKTSTQAALWLGILGIIWMLYKRRWMMCFLLISSFLSTCLTVFGGGKYFNYYSYIFCVFYMFGICFIAELFACSSYLTNKIIIIKNLLATIFLFISMLCLCFFSRNIYFMENEKDDLMPYRIAEVIKNSQIKNPSVLEYKTMATGVNTAAGLIPNVKYFCLFNIPDFIELEQEQDSCVKTGCADFLVIESFRDDIFPEFDKYKYINIFRGNISSNWKTIDSYFYLYERR